MRSAKLETSHRLQRALSVLKKSGWITTRSLLRKAHLAAVSPTISELRENGCDIECEQRVCKDGTRRWHYRLIKAPEGW